MELNTIREADLKDKRVLVRVDFNVPLDENGRVTDDTRIRAALPTVNYLLQQGAAVILMSHLGRPKGKVVEKMRLTGVAERLSELLGREVKKSDDCIGPEVEGVARALKPGEVLLLENLRFHPEEEKNDPGFARALASLGEIYVNDAFGTAHRAHASTAGVADYLPAYAGFLMEKEIKALGGILGSPERPFLALLGGAKVSDKIGVLENLVDKVDGFLFGGGMANTFLKAQGHSLGDSLYDAEHLEFARRFLENARVKGIRVELPEDLVIARDADGDETRTVAPSGVPEGWKALDIGPKTVERYQAAISQAKTVFWNGPLGLFEKERFAKGSLEVARALTGAGVTSVVGGGDTLAVLEKAGLADKVTHASTGGGASLEFLEGKLLPGVAVLEKK